MNTPIYQSPARPIAFVLAATHQGTLIVNRNDYNVNRGTAYGVGLQLLTNSAFDPQEVNFAMQLLSTRHRNFGPGVVALDCGANIGVHTLEWAKHMQGWGQVMAFEAQERIFYALAGNIALNNCFNAQALWAAVGETVGEIGVPVPNYLKPASFGSLEIRKTARTEFIGQSIDYDRLVRTHMISIDSLEFDRLDFLKIDIEGMEMEALRGAQQTIARHKPQMLIEKIKTSEDQLTKFLMERGYTLFPIDINVLAVHESDPAVKMIRIEQATKRSEE